MDNNNSRPEDLWEMLELGKSTPANDFGWWYNENQGWIVPYFINCSGLHQIPDKESIKQLIKGLQEFCAIVSTKDIAEFNDDMISLGIKLKRFEDKDHAMELLPKETIQLGITPKEPGYVYILKAADTGFYKVGRTNNIDKRKQSLQTGSYHKLSLFRAYESANPVLDEDSMKKSFAKYKVSGEWYNLPEELAQGLEPSTVE